jgi:DNA-binding protein Fis
MPIDSAATSPRRAVVLSERVSNDLARALSAAGLEVRTGGNPSAPDVILVDPRIVAATGMGIEELISARVCEVLARVGDGGRDLHESVMTQTERGLLAAALAFTGNHLGRASKILGLDRNTCARKARAFGFVEVPSRGRKPRPSGRGTRRSPPRKKRR